VLYFWFNQNRLFWNKLYLLFGYLYFTVTLQIQNTVIMRKTDEQLIVDYLEGDDSSLSFLVDRYLADIYRFSVHLTNNPAAAEDVTQEAFIKAWKSIRSYRKGTNFKGWLFTIARNTAIDYLRKHQSPAISSFENSEGKNVLLEKLADSTESIETLLVQAEDADYVSSLLLQLDPKYGEVLKLRYSHELTFEEIGKILGKPLHTVKSQHRRALASLRRLAEAKFS